MTKTSDPKISPAERDDFTCITFYPDLPKFKMDTLDQDTVDLFTRRAYDLAATSQGVKIFLNGKRLPVKNFKEYVQLYLKVRRKLNNFFLVGLLLTLLANLIKYIMCSIYEIL